MRDAGGREETQGERGDGVERAAGGERQVAFLSGRIRAKMSLPFSVQLDVRAADLRVSISGARAQGPGAAGGGCAVKNQAFATLQVDDIAISNDFASGYMNVTLHGVCCVFVCVRARVCARVRLCVIHPEPQAPPRLRP